MAAATGAREAEEVLPDAPPRVMGAAELGGAPTVARKTRDAVRHEHMGRLEQG